jgi:hypothetical protein
MSLRAVVTTVQPPTTAMRELADRVARAGGRLMVAGDAQGPDAYALSATDFLSLAAQKALPFRLAAALPTRNYARKNLAYLSAIAAGATCIYETDDDNAPLPEWSIRTRETDAEPVTPRPWVNVYRIFSDALVWPRGFPLARIRDPTTWAHSGGVTERVGAPIQQGLHDGNPDADAIWRLTLLDETVRFARRPSVVLPPHCWAPVNSQSTWWWPDAFPLLYIPVHCPPRMPDIWRGYVAQRCLWAMHARLVFHAPEVRQVRNAHDLMRNFADEVGGYLSVERLAAALDELTLDSAAVGDNMVRCYERLIALDLVGTAERKLLKMWLADVDDLCD